jgi:hypothetical protein
MAKLSRDLSGGTLHPRETLMATGLLGALNSLIEMPADGCASVVLDLRGTYNIAVTVEASVDNANWQTIPLRPLNSASVAYAISVGISAQGSWTGSIAGFRFVRARCNSYTSGAATAVLTANAAPLDASLIGAVTPFLATIIGTVGAATTLTLPTPGSSLRQYLTSLSINRFAAAALTPAAAPIAVTSTNLPGSLSYSFGAEALAQGALDRMREEFGHPLAASAQNTAVTIVAPATPNVIWRMTAGYYVAP